MAQKNMWNLLQTTLLENDDFIKAIIGDDENRNDLLVNLNGILQSKLKVN
jgi:hypothetical protein